MYDIWFCPEYPVDAIRVSTKVPREGREEWRIALAENIREKGLANPLIVLNHRDPQQWEHHWLMTGTNRHWAINFLGWKTVPCIVTGECEFEPKQLVRLDELQSYFKDGEVYLADTGPRLRDVCLPEKYEYPN